MKVNLLLLLLSCGLFAFTARSQATFRISQDVASFDIAGGMVENSTGDLVFAGTNSNFIPFFGNIVKMNSSGTVQWAKAYTGGIASSLNDIKAVSSGGYIVTGTSSNGGAILIRVDESGNTLWSKRYQCPDKAGKPSSEYGNAVIETSDGGFVVAGGVDYFWDGVSANTIDTASALGFKVDASGVLQWSRVFAITTANPDEHYFNDVAEVSDGYIFVGISSEGSGTPNDDGDYPRNALIAKTTTAGATTYINRWGAGNTSSQGLNCANTLASGEVIIGGYDDVHGTITRIAGPGGSVTVNYGRRLSGAAFPPVAVIIQDIDEHSDGSYGIIGTRIEALSFSFYTFIGKFNPATNAFAFDRGYLPIGLSAILPEGGIAANQGYYVVMTDQQAGGFNYNIIRTDNAGQLGGAAGCTVNNITQSTASSVPTIQAITNTQYTPVTESSFTPVVTNLTPTPVVHCITTPCTPPAAATTVTATPSTICAGQSSTITASGPASGVTYNVYTSSSGGTNLGATPLAVSPSGTTTYYIETAITASPSCVSTTRTPVTVTVNPVPTATPGSNSPVCAGQTINLTSPTIAGTYSWTGPNAFSSTAEDPSIPNATAAEAGTYTLTVTAGGCTSAPANVTVTVSPLPVASPSSNSPVCEGGTINLLGNNIPSATYSWSGPNAFSSTSEDPSLPATAAAAGTYTLTITSGSCTSAPATTNVTINALPNATAGSNSPICEGSDILLSSSGGTGYSWSGPNSYSDGSQNPTITGATSAEAGTYTVTVTDANGCQNTAQTTVSVVAGETVTASATDVTCNGADDGTATAGTSGAGPYTYSWSPGGGTGATATGLAPGTYTVTVTTGGCSSTANATVNEPAIIGLSTSSTASSCTTPTGSATVVATGGAGGYAYSWSPSGGSGATASNLAAGSYTITVTDANGCQATATENVASVNGPSATISASSDVSCAGLTDGSATVTASGGTPGYTYSWSPSGGSAATASGLGAGTYTVTVTDNAGCTATANTTLTAPAAIALSETLTDPTCGNADGSISVAASGGSPGYTYAWTPAGNTATIGNLPGGNYSVTVTDASGCTATDSYVLTPSGSLDVDVTPPSSTILQGESVGLTASVIPPVPGVTYTWLPATGLSCDDCPNPTATPSVTTIYTVEATSPDGCTGTASATIFVELICGEYFMPTIFSPNEDLNNDELCLLGSCITELSLKIYDRWGELVFETTDQSECWDGTFKGKPMNAASYVYVLELTLQDGTTVSEKGNVTLVR